MSPVVLRGVARPMVPVLVLFSWVLTVRGHDAPGGGFVGGAMAATAGALLMVAHGPRALRRLVPVHPLRLAASGLLVSLGSGLPSMLLGRPFLTGLWAELPLPWGGTLGLGTPLLFDAGVYLLVLGTALAFLLALGARHGELPEDLDSHAGGPR